MVLRLYLVCVLVCWGGGTPPQIITYFCFYFIIDRWKI